jgi:hypothetical protein
MLEICSNGRVYYVVNGVVYMSRKAALEARNGSR